MIQPLIVHCIWPGVCQICSETQSMSQMAACSGVEGKLWFQICFFKFCTLCDHNQNQYAVFEMSDLEFVKEIHLSFKMYGIICDTFLTELNIQNYSSFTPRAPILVTSVDHCTKF